MEKQTGKILDELNGDENQRLTHNRTTAARKIVADRLQDQPVDGRDLIDHIALANNIHPTRLPEGSKRYIAEQLHQRANLQAEKLGQNNVDNDWVDSEIKTLLSLVATSQEAVGQAQQLAPPEDVEAPQSLLACHQQAEVAADQAVRNLLAPSTEPADLVKSLFQIADHSRAYTERRFAASGTDSKPGEDDYSTDLATFFDQAVRSTPEAAKRYQDLMGPDGRGRALLFGSSLIGSDGQMLNPERNFVGEHQAKQTENLEMNKLTRTLDIAFGAIAIRAGAPNPSKQAAGLMQMGDRFGTQQQTSHGNPLSFDTTSLSLPGTTLREAGLNSDKQLQLLLRPMRDQVVQRANRIRQQNPIPEQNRERSESLYSDISDIGDNAD